MKARRVLATVARMGQCRWSSDKTTPEAKADTPKQSEEIPPTEEKTEASDAIDTVEAEADKKDNSIFEDTSERRMVERKYPTPDELFEKYGILSQMDDRHRHLTEREYAQLWWKVRDTYSAVTENIMDIHTTQQQKDNWEATYQLFVRRLPPYIQELYQDTFNKKYLSFRPPKVSILGMPPPADYLDVWQAEQPTFYIRETLANPRTFAVKSIAWGILDKYGMAMGWSPKGGYAKLQCAHTLINDNPNPHYVYAAKRIPGQVCKLLPETKAFPRPRTTRGWTLRQKDIGNTPDFLSLPWIQIVKVMETDEGETAEVKVFKTNSHDSQGNPSEDYELKTVDFDRIIGGSDRLDYISLGEPLRKPECKDIIRFLWPAPLVDNEVVKYHYSQEGHEYPWELPTMRATSASEFNVHALLLPYEFISKHEPDLPNTLGKISIVVGDREFPIMVDFWDALQRFAEARRNLVQSACQLAALFLICSAAWAFVAGVLKLGMYEKLLKPYNYKELSTHPRYKHIYGADRIGRETGPAPWEYEKD